METRISITLTQKQIEAIREIAKSEGNSVAVVVRRAIDQFLEPRRTVFRTTESERKE